VHYTAGVGTVFSFAGASLVPGQGPLSTLARLLLDGAGALFGLYLLLAFGLALYGRVLRRHRPGHQLATGLPRPVPARLPGPAVPASAGGTPAARTQATAPGAPDPRSDASTGWPA
jgi:hypothetical protein